MRPALFIAALLFANDVFAAEKASVFEAYGELFAIFILLAVVVFVISRLPTVEEVNHSPAFKRRRVMNWLPLGLTYAFLYMGRYNLKVSKFKFEEMQDAAGGALMSNEGFGVIFTVGVWVYGCSFLVNGPLTDRLGGRFAILVGAGGSALANLLMGLASWSLINEGPMHTAIGQNFITIFSVLYGINMYFQSFGAVAVVKCNAPWFHVRERGVFGAIFGILISLGIYFAFDVGYKIVNHLGVAEVFFIPAVLLVIFWVADFMMVQNSPADAGLDDFDTADASSGDDGPQLGALEVFKRMLTNPIIITIALVEFCSGFIRQAPMQWYRTFAKQTDEVLQLKGDFIYDHWGMWLCVAGIMGGVLAGVISDRVFQSRRGPVAAILYLGVTLGSIALLFAYQTPAMQVGGIKLSLPGVLAILISMCVIGVHGMLSGTASMDFGGRKNVGIAVGIIDGFVYLGTGVMSLTYAYVLPQERFDETGKLIGEVTQPANWSPWPISMIIVGAAGFLLATRVWNAKPKGKGQQPPEPKEEAGEEPATA
jgi:OPA family glycerol-3-phosphate transporter-like MFS transporter|tara:strand:- start:117 stop:1730 length:1614 start_codon:yes stop_codon:yes gene_type:complete